MADVLSARFGFDVEVGGLARLPGGASCEIYAFRAPVAAGEPPRDLVLRMDPPGGSIEGDRREEYRLLDAAGRGGVTVPRVYADGDPTDRIRGAFLVMDRIRGEAIARRLLRDERYEVTRRALPGDLACELARIHAIDTADPTLDFLGARVPEGADGRRFALAEVTRLRSGLDVVGGGRPYPVLALAGRWLAQNAPEIEKPAVVHGDYRVGNVMFDEAGLTAVLDWELSHLGDPAEDLGWLCVRAWRFGRDERAVGGLCSRGDLTEAYAAAGGSEVSRERLRYWEIYGNWKWAVICLMQESRHKAGRYPDIELATIGRRVADTEWELLELLDD